MHVLVVESNLAGQESLTARLQRTGFKVTTVADGRSALTALGRWPIDGIVCHPRLPLEGAVDFYSGLAAQHPDAAATVVFLLPKTEAGTVRKVKKKTGRPTFAEPCDIGELANALRTLGDKGANRRVLIIEDDVANRTALTKAIRKAGFEADAAEDGIAGYARLQQQSYGVIVCDVRMPYLGGKSFFEQIEEAYPNMASRVVFVTAWANEPDTRAFLERTGQPFLPKPYDVEQLTQAVADIARRPR